LINIVLKGLKDVEIDGERYDNPMPAFDFLTDSEVADVLTYVRNNFTNKAGGVKTEEVAMVRKSKK
jgi:mono/diheme cytochrome c family protein